MINEVFFVASIAAKPEEGWTKTGTRTTQSRLEIVECGDSGRAWRTWCPVISYVRVAERLLEFHEGEMIVARGKIGQTSDADVLLIVGRDITPCVVPADMGQDDAAKAIRHVVQALHDGDDIRYRHIRQASYCPKQWRSDPGWPLVLHDDACPRGAAGGRYECVVDVLPLAPRARGQGGMAMANQKKPYAELLQTKRKRNGGSLSALQRQLWHGLKIVDVALTEAMQRNDDESLRRWLHLLTQMSGAYSKLCETVELDEKLRAVETFINEKKAKNQSFRGCL